MTGENTKKINALLSPTEGEVASGENSRIKEGDQGAGSTQKALQKKKRGRPPGAKNKDTIFKELMTGEFQSLATQEVKKVFGVLFEKAKEGDMTAIKMIMDRVVPASKAIDLEKATSGGITVHISVGSLEDSPLVAGEIIEDAEFEEVKDA